MSLTNGSDWPVSYPLRIFSQNVRQEKHKFIFDLAILQKVEHKYIKVET